MNFRWQSDYVELILAPISLAIMLWYNLDLYRRFRSSPMRTTLGVNHSARRLWVHFIMKGGDKGILAVQTLRNIIMGSTLLASTTILLSAGMAAFLASSYGLKTALQTNILGTQNFIALYIRFLSLLISYIFAFFCLAQSVRFTNHVNFMIGLPTEERFPADYVADVLERGANLHAIGAKAFYMTIPMLFWLFSPQLFFISTLVLIPFCRWLDTVQELKLPKVESTC